jgi:hypothetical protein
MVDHDHKLQLFMWEALESFNITTALPSTGLPAFNEDNIMPYTLPKDISKVQAPANARPIVICPGKPTSECWQVSAAAAMLKQHSQASIHNWRTPQLVAGSSDLCSWYAMPLQGLGTAARTTRLHLVSPQTHWSPTSRSVVADVCC